MTKLESIRNCSYEIPTVVHCIPAKPHGIQDYILRRHND